MKLRLAPTALAEAKSIMTWWRTNRPAAADLSEQELNATLERIASTPTLGSPYEGGNLGVPVRRLLLPKSKSKSKSKNHVYFVVDGDKVIVISVWGAPKSRGPKL